MQKHKIIKKNRLARPGKKDDGANHGNKQGNMALSTLESHHHPPNDEEGGSESDDQNLLNKEKNKNTVRRPRCNALLHEMPEWMRDNEYIVSGYRVDYEGPLEVSQTICKCHNETVNVWTHLVGSLIMLLSGMLYLFNQENHAHLGQAGWRLFEDHQKLMMTENPKFALANFTDQQLTLYGLKIDEYDSQLMKMQMDAAMSSSEQCALLITKLTKQMVENSNDFKEHAEWNTLTNQIDTYTTHNKLLITTLSKQQQVFSSESEKSKISANVVRLKILNQGMGVLLQTAKDTRDNLVKIMNSPKLIDLIIVDKVLAYVPSWPLVVHLISGFFCLGFSALYHLFWIQSQFVNNWMSRLDYGGICILIMGSSYPPIFYAFSCGPILSGRNFFLFLITFTSITTFFMFMMPVMNSGKYRMCRAVWFIILGLSAGLPFVYIIMMRNQYHQFYLPTTTIIPWFIGGLVYIGGALIYGFRIPEKYIPKKFDIIGASHQIFHIAVILGFSIMFNDAVRLYRVSKDFVCPIEVPKTF